MSEYKSMVLISRLSLTVLFASLERRVESSRAKMMMVSRRADQLESGKTDTKAESMIFGSNY